MCWHMQLPEKNDNMMNGRWFAQNEDDTHDEWLSSSYFRTSTIVSGFITAGKVHCSGKFSTKKKFLGARFREIRVFQLI